ncbi:MAG: response regulator [Candidatus Korobacteraceae bacterium]
MDLNQLAVQLESLLAAAYSQPITTDLSTGIEHAGVQSGLAKDLLEVLVEEICAYGQVDSLVIWTEQTAAEEAKRSRVSLGIEVYSRQITAPEPKTETMRELSTRLRDIGCVLQLRAAAGRWMRYEVLFPVGTESDHGVYGSGRGETILLVEDEEFVRDVTAQVLEGCGYRVLAAKDATTAMDIFNRNRGSIGVLLTDLGLAGESGAELAEKLSGSDPLLKVILMSGYTEREMIGREFGDTGMAYLAKPFSAEALVGKVRQVTQSPLADEIAGSQPDAALGAELR